MVPRSIACPVDQKISNPNERNGKCLNNSNEFRPACAGEDTELDSPLTGRFKRNWTVSCIIRWKQKLGHCSNWSSITGNNNKPQQQRKLMSQRFAKGGKFNGMLWECFGRVFVEHATLLFFGNVKFLDGGRANVVDSAPDRRWLLCWDGWTWRSRRPARNSKSEHQSGTGCWCGVAAWKPWRSIYLNVNCI